MGQFRVEPEINTKFTRAKITGRALVRQVKPKIDPFLCV